MSSKVKEHKIDLIVLIPPKIKVLKLVEEITEDQTEDVAKCMAEGGKPRAQVEWKFLNLAEDLTALTGTEESMLTLTPRREMHKTIVQCVVNHDALDQPKIESITLNVKFAPGQPTMKIIDANCDDEENEKKLKIICEDNLVQANPK